MKTNEILFIKDIWNKVYRRILDFHPIPFYLLFVLFVFLFGTTELYSQSKNQITYSVIHDRSGNDCNDFICGDNDDKLLICHVPPGNPENEHEICISTNAVQTHLTHGDYCGPCTLLSNSSLENSPNISIYPNPFKNSLFVELKQDLLTSNENLEIIIYDLLGRTIKRIGQINKAKFEIDLSDLNNGIFIYNISNENGILGKGKIIKN